MSTSRLSVVMTAWNAERFIVDALQSVANQTIAPHEVIVVDDGSTDGTAKEAERSGATVLRRPHAGIGLSRNAGIDACSGDVIAFLDADDLWLPTKIEAQASVLDGDPLVDAVYCLVDEFIDRRAEASTAVRAPKLGFAGALSSATAVRRSLVDRLGPFDEMAVGDWVQWWARARRMGAVERLVPEVLVRRRIHDDNNSARMDDGGERFLQIAREHRRAKRDGA